jgi:hypothetical protein
VTYNYFCKRCGLSKDFDSKEGRAAFKEEHKPKSPSYVLTRLRFYACQLQAREENGIVIYRRA